MWGLDVVLHFCMYVCVCVVLYYDLPARVCMCVLCGVVSVFYFPFCVMNASVLCLLHVGMFIVFGECVLYGSVPCGVCICDV